MNIFQEPYNDILGCPVPNGNIFPKNIKDLNRIYTIPSWVDKLSIKEDFDQIYSFKENEQVKIVTENSPIQNYLYIIRVFSPTYFSDNKNLGFSMVNPKVLKDVKKGKAKIVIECTTEGLYPIQNSSHEYQNPNLYLNVIDQWVLNSNLSSNSVWVLTGDFNSTNYVKNNNLHFHSIGVSSFEDGFLPDLPWPLPQDCNLDFKLDGDLFLFYSRMAREHRVYFIFLLEKYNLISKGKISLIKPKILTNNYLSHSLLKEYQEFLNKPNYNLDYTWKNEDESVNLWDKINYEHYQNTFLSVIGETLYHYQAFFSEKTWKPIATGQPFIMLGGYKSLYYLKKLGYKTFDQWWDESYDLERDPHKRMNLIIKELIKLSKKTTDELTEIRNEMKETLNHNYRIYKDKITLILDKNVSTPPLSNQSILSQLLIINNSF